MNDALPETQSVAFIFSVTERQNQGKQNINLKAAGTGSQGMN